MQKRALFSLIFLVVALALNDRQTQALSRALVGRYFPPTTFVPKIISKELLSTKQVTKIGSFLPQHCVVDKNSKPIFVSWYDTLFCPCNAPSYNVVNSVVGVIQYAAHNLVYLWDRESIEVRTCRTVYMTPPCGAVFPRSIARQSGGCQQRRYVFGKLSARRSQRRPFLAPALFQLSRYRAWKSAQGGVTV